MNQGLDRRFLARSPLQEIPVGSEDRYPFDVGCRLFRPDFADLVMSSFSLGSALRTSSDVPDHYGQEIAP